MADWWEEIDDRSHDERKASKLANYLSRYPGDRKLKVRWCLNNLTLLEAEVDAAEKETERGRWGELRRVTIRFSRAWVRRQQHTARWGPDPEKPQERGTRDGQIIRLADEIGKIR